MGLVEPERWHLAIARQMRAKARTGWYIGTMFTLEEFGARRLVASQVEPELTISMTLSRDKMHHSVGWWRNAEYEYCWHLSLAAKSVPLPCDQHEWSEAPWEDLPRAEVRFWAAVIFEGVDNLLWSEPGGTDPRLTNEEARERAKMWHFRMFLDPESIDERVLPWTGMPFIPNGEVYQLTRWIPGLTPDKVDR